MQSRLFKSLKLWSFYVDLEESIGTVESTKAVYDKIMELKIANAQVIVNYAQFLEENKYYEESFKVCFVSVSKAPRSQCHIRCMKGVSIFSSTQSLSSCGTSIYPSLLIVMWVSGEAQTRHTLTDM